MGNSRWPNFNTNDPNREHTYENYKVPPFRDYITGIPSKNEVMQFRLTHLGDISPSVLHGYQVVRALNDELGPRSVCGSRGNSAPELLIKSLIKLIIINVGWREPVIEANDNLGR